ncbi:hypothetical protein ACQJBY_073592 [Aegilops geniculata]
MASSSIAVAAALILVSHAYGCYAKHHASPAAANSSWLDAKATWYGAPQGAGPDDNGGACGFKNVNLPPFSSMTSCGNQPLFKDGKGCGSCYQIRCLKSDHPACSGVPKTVIITDMNYYPVSRYHFDLSGTAFGAMAKDGRNDELRHAGIINMQFKNTHWPIMPVSIITIALPY